MNDWDYIRQVMGESEYTNMMANHEKRIVSINGVDYEVSCSMPGTSQGRPTFTVKNLSTNEYVTPQAFYTAYTTQSTPEPTPTPTAPETTPEPTPETTPEPTATPSQWWCSLLRCTCGTPPRSG